jgi:hypothetical protein
MRRGRHSAASVLGWEVWEFARFQSEQGPRTKPGQNVALLRKYPYLSKVQGLTTLRFEWIQGCFPKFEIPAASIVCRISWDQAFLGPTTVSSV